jgi:tripartite-type tricarboxylate transporter receptor subunit TctC
MKPITRFLATVATAFAALNAAAQYPDRPIKLVVPFAAGGSVDVVGRLLAGRLAEVLGQPVIVDNRGGAGGTIGADFVAKAPPDGYTLLLAAQGHQSFHPLLYKKLPYDAHKAFTQVALFSTVPNVLVVSSKVPAKTVKEFIAHSKSGRKLFMGSSGNGGVNHMIGELFMHRTGTQFEHVPYKGAAPATIDLVTGQIDLMFVNLPNVLSHVQTGKLRVLAIASTKRSPVLPDVPTMAEAGVADLVVESWSGVLAPAGTPKPILDKLAAAITQITGEKAMADSLAAQGAVPFPGGSSEYAALVRFESERWGEVVRKANITLE